MTVAHQREARDDGRRGLAGIDGESGISGSGGVDDRVVGALDAGQFDVHADEGDGLALGASEDDRAQRGLVHRLVLVDVTVAVVVFTVAVHVGARVLQGIDHSTGLGWDDQTRCTTLVAQSRAGL